MAVLGEWYRKFAALTATKKWGAGATLLSAMGRKGCFRWLFWGNGIASSLRSPQQNAMGRKGCSGVDGIASSLRSPQQNALGRKGCSGGMVSQVRCAHRYEEMGRKGCSGGMVSQVRCAHRYEEMGCRGHASECNGSQGLFYGLCWGACMTFRIAPATLPCWKRAKRSRGIICPNWHVRPLGTFDRFRAVCLMSINQVGIST